MKPRKARTLERWSAFYGWPNHAGGTWYGLQASTNAKSQEEAEERCRRDADFRRRRAAETGKRVRMPHYMVQRIVTTTDNGIEVYT